MNRNGSEMKAYVYGTLGVSAALLLVLVFSYGSKTYATLIRLWQLSPTLLTGSNQLGSFSGGFAANVIISIVAMLISIIAGSVMGYGLISDHSAVKRPSILLMNFLRNSPWLVILYAMLYLIPYELDFVGVSISLPPEVKAIIGLSLPISANVADVFRAGVRAIPLTQWEASQALGYSRGQSLREIILPQALPMMLPNMMTVYASLFIGTSLVVVTGTDDVLSVAKLIIASGNDQIATAIYLYILFMFFMFAFPIAMFSRWCEKWVREA